uniref:Uncharacterized protein LOC104214393 n=1 Tax=Nicotiana sylvestris TaxID=4096 RepID=A0A1U7V287_NICSY|nr:PREDICTED: uncharacterized protein LOC104214393 [Nicotiana sylvestris]
MKLNPEKCAFSVTSGKFLASLVSQRGIDINQDQIKAIDAIPEVLTIKKQVQKLTWRIAALSRFISRSSDRCHKFFNVLRKDHRLQWNEECIDALRKLKAYLSSAPLLIKADLDGLAKLAAATRNINKENMVTLLHSAIDHAEDGTLPQDKKEAKKLWVQAVRYNLVNRDLYKRTFGGPLAKCLGPHQIRRVLEEIHEGHCGAHTGNRALARCLIRIGYYWPTMKNKAANYVRRCEQCQRYIHSDTRAVGHRRHMEKHYMSFWHPQRNQLRQRTSVRRKKND